tara:strand:- start:1393 stop:2472 length:1080 start_codon:yes stop_codon:yes gene_type:complete
MQKIVLVFTLISLFTILNSALAEPENGVDANETLSAERAAYLDPELKNQMALANTLKDYETVWLDVNYPDISDARKILAISRPSLIVEKKGAVLLLHDKEQHADWPEVIRPLRKNLPKWGWFTLSVNLPDETREQAPQRVLEAKEFDQVMMNTNLKNNLDSGVRVRNELEEKEASETIDDASKAPPTDLEQSNDGESVDIDLAAQKKQADLNKIPYDIRSLSHIEKAYEYLQSQNYQNIVLIAYGHSAELAFQYIKAHQTATNSPGFTLILIEPSLTQAYLLDLSEWLGKGFKAPILEIIDRNDAEEAESRKYAVLRAGAEKYRQTFLNINNNEIFDENLSRRVRTWLDTNAPGLEVGL